MNTKIIIFLLAKLVFCTGIAFGQYSAGKNKVLCTNYTVMNAELPAGATGKWTKIKGEGVILKETDPNSTIVNLGLGENIFAWEVTKDGTTYKDEVRITNNSPSLANAGVDFTACTSSSPLDAAVPTVGFGTWQVLGESTASFSDLHDPKAIASNLSLGKNTLRWTVTNGACSNYQDVTIDSKGLWVQAGSDITSCVSNVQLTGLTNATSSYWMNHNTDVNFANNQSANTTVGNLKLGKNAIVLKAVQGSCRLTDTLIVQYDATPNKQELTVEINYCEGETAEIKLNNSETEAIYSLFKGNTLIQDLEGNNSELTFKGVKQGQYRIEAKFKNSSCKLDLKNDISINELAKTKLKLSKDATVCRLSTIELSAEGGDKFNWYDNGKLISEENSIQFKATKDQYVVVKNETTNNCNSVDSIRIQVLELPNIEAGEDREICAGEKITLHATGGNDYTWKSTGSNGEAIEITPTESMWQYVTGSNEFCSNIDSLFIQVHPMPEVNLGKDTTIYENQSIFLDAGQHLMYSWSTGAKTKKYIFSGSEFGVGTHNINVKVSNIYACVSSDEISITVAAATGTFNLLEDTELNIYPTPAQDIVNIQSDLFVKESAMFTIYDLSGRTINSFDRDAGSDKIEIPIQDLKEGMYIVQIKVQNTSTQIRFIKK